MTFESYRTLTVALALALAGCGGGGGGDAAPNPAPGQAGTPPGETLFVPANATERTDTGWR